MDNFNPCESINDAFTQQVRIERLLTLLRSSQSACTDNDCINTVSLPNADAASTPLDPAYWSMVFGLLLAVVFLILARPSSLRKKETKSNQNSQNDRDDDDNNNNGGFVPPVL